MQHSKPRNRAATASPVPPAPPQTLCCSLVSMHDAHSPSSCLALLGNYIIHGMSGRSVHNSLSLPGRISLFAFGAAKVKATPGQGDSQLGTLGFPREEKQVLMHPWLQDETSEGIFLSPHQLCCAYSTILLLICRTAIEGRQQRNEGIASQFPSVANKIHQALWENQELYLQSASFYLLRDKQG